MTFIRFLAPIAWGLVGLSAAPVAAQPAPGPDRFESQLGNIDTALKRLERLYARPDASLRSFTIQRRLVDARVFYELGQYENCAMILVDVIDRPEFKASLDYAASLLLLGESLFKLGNVNGAREIFQRVAVGRDTDIADEARLYLLEIALSSGRDSDIEAAIRTTPQTIRTDRLKYGLGKAWFRLGKHEDAAAQLQSVAPQSEWYMRARYYLGASLVGRGAFEPALEIYRNIVGAPGDDEFSQTIREEAWLAIGRLLVQKKNYALALTSYQNIGRNSPLYETALYEMAWAYINQEQFDKAIQTVEVLLLNVASPEVDVEANVLLGQLNVAKKDYEEAISSYESIIERFAPIRNELARFVQNPTAVRGYFEWLTRRKGSLGALGSPLSERSLKWLENTADFKRIGTVFDGIATERETIRQAREIGGELKEILSDRGRVEVFPELKEGWARLQVAENQLILLLIEMLDLQRQELKTLLTAEEAQDFQMVWDERSRVTTGGLRLPSTFEAFNERQEAATSQFRDLAKRHFLVQKGMDELQRQLMAIEKHLNERQFAESGVRLSPESETELRKEIAAEKISLQAVYDELAGLSREIDIETRKLGAGDNASVAEQGMKTQLRQAIEREAELYDRIGQRVGGNVATRYRGLVGVRERSDQLLTRMGSLLALMDAEVRRKTAELLVVVDTELNHLGNYRAEAEGLAADGDDISTRHGMDFFLASLQRMGQVVLDAEVGLLDVVWARKTEQTAALQRLNEDRGRRLKGLQTSLDSIKAGAGDEPIDVPAGGKAP